MKWTTGDLIKEYAKNKGLTLHKLANLANVSYNTLYSIVRRKSDRVDRQIIEKLAKAMNVSPVELMPFDDAGLLGTKSFAPDGSFSLEIENEINEAGLATATIRIDPSTINIDFLNELRTFIKERGFSDESLLYLNIIEDIARIIQSQKSSKHNGDNEGV